MHRNIIIPLAVLSTALLAIAIGSSIAEAEPEAISDKVLAPYRNGFPPPAPNPKVKTKIELVENAQGLLVRSEKSYQEAQDHVASYLEDTYLNKLRKHYPKQRDVQVKVAENPSTKGLLIHENLIYARWGNGRWFSISTCHPNMPNRCRL